MRSAEAKYANHLNEWPPLRPECHPPCHHVETLAREKTLPFGSSTARFRGVVAAS
jgi:hypothetical protein